MNWICSLASAVLLVLLFPGYNLTFLAPIALTPLLIACGREPQWRTRFAFGYLCGVVYWFGLCHWMQWTLKHHAGMSATAAWMVFLLVCLAKAMQMGVFAALASRLPPPLIAALWVAMEWTHNYTWLEWLNLGNAGSDMSLLLRLAPFTGVWGLSFAFVLMAAVIASVVMRRERLASAWLLILPCVFLLPDIPAPQRGDRTAVIVQPDIDDETLWSTELQERTEQQLGRLSLPGQDRPADVIVWPEMPGPFYENDPRFIAMVSATAKTAQAAVLTGAVGRSRDQSPLNSALIVGPDGAMISRYDKVNLVPFGEFVPWPLGPLTQKVSTEAGDFVPGDKVVVSQVGQHKIGTFICYESAFSGYVRKFVANGAEALFTISNDSWFGKSQARYQHLRIVRMRAAENRRWIVRATNDGVSAVIDPAGRLVQTAPEFQEVTARMPYGYRRDLTFYTRFGDWFVALCALAVAAAGVITRVADTRRQAR